MLKFIINISCVFNLAVIFMLTSSLTTEKDNKAQDNITNNATSKLEASQELNNFISMLKTNYPKLETSGFDRSFLNGSIIVFLNQCTTTDIKCLTYFDMLLRLTDNVTEDSLESIKTKLLGAQVSAKTFCADFNAVLPDVPFSTVTSISMRMKDFNICTIECIKISSTLEASVRPACGISLLGYQHIAATSSVSTTLVSSTGNQVSNLKRVSASPIVLPNIVPQVNATEPEKVETNHEKTTSNVIAILKADAISKATNSSPSNGLKQLPNGIVSPSVDEKIAASSDNPAVTNDAKSAGSVKNETIDSIKFEGNEGKIGQKINSNSDIDKAENAEPNAEINPIGNAPPVDRATPSERTFIPNNNNVFDGAMNAPPGNDELSGEYDGDQDGQNPDEEIHSNEKSGELDLVKNIDMLGEQKLVDAAYGKYKKADENNENVDQFTQDTDSNFFMYFMFIMVLCVMFYIIYHNKTKVLALVLEGRRGSHSVRGIGRRKHTAAYRKLDSNLEEAITSNASGRTTQIIY